MGTFIIAEISANHGHCLDTALATIKTVKDSGADAVKIQTYTPDTMTLDCDNKYFQIKQGTIWDGTALYELYKQAYTPWEWHEELFRYAREIGIEIFSTPFDHTAVDLLETLNVNRYKIASFEITDIPLIELVASKMKPMIISTGIATFEEITDAVEACRRKGNNDITLLQCTSQYPANPADANLLTMVDMKERFGVKVGLSDHTMGHDVAVAAAAMGAEIIEKHFILDRNIGGPDANFSMTPSEFREMVEKVRFIETLMGNVSYDITEKKKNSRVFARSLFVVENVKKGEAISQKNVRSIRPGYGLAPKHLSKIIGRRFMKDIERGTPLSWDVIEDGNPS
jgi:pseudaminic acid synthase